MATTGGPNQVGTAYVVIRGVTKNVKKDIVGSFKDAFKIVEKESEKSGILAGRRWAKGFNVGVKSSDLSSGVHRVWRDLEREAESSGRRAGERYASAYNAAIKRSTRSSAPEMDSESRLATRRQNITSTNNDDAAARKQQLTQQRAAADQQRKQEAASRRARLLSRGSEAAVRNVTRKVTTVFNSVGDKALKASLVAIAGLLRGIGTLAAAAMAAMASQAAIAGLTAVLGSLTQISGVLLTLPAAANAFGLVLGTMKVGLSGIKDALSAGSEASQQAGANAKAQEQAITSAQRGITSALRNREQAERGLDAAQRNRIRAQQDYSRAIKDATRELEDYNMQLKGASIDEEDALIGVERARERLRNMPKDSTALDWREARNSLKKAKQSLEETRVSNKRLGEDSQEAFKKGVKGADQVVDAAQNIHDADQAVIDAKQQLADANQQLADAYKALEDAMSGAAGAADKFAEAMAKLSPNAQKMVRALLAIKDQFKDIKMAVQDRMFAGLDKSVQKLATATFPVLKDAMVETAGIVNGVAKDIMGAFSTKESVGQFRTVLSRANDMLAKMRPGFLALAGVWKNLSVVGSEFFGGAGDGFTKGAQSLERWTSNFDRMRKIIRSALDVLKTLWSVVKSIGGAFGALFAAVAPYTDSMLGSVREIGEGLSRIFTSAEGKNSLDEFFSNGAKSLELLAPMIEPLARSVLTIGSALSGLGRDISPGVLDFVTGLSAGLENLKPFFEVVGPKISNLFSVLGEHMPQLGTTLSALGTGFAPVIDQLSWLVDHVAPPMMKFLEFIAPAILPITAAVLGMAFAWKLANKAINIKKNITQTVDGLRGFVRGESDAEDQAENTTNRLRDQERVQNSKGESASALENAVNDLSRAEEDLADTATDTSNRLKRSSDDLKVDTSPIDSGDKPKKKKPNYASFQDDSEEPEDTGKKKKKSRLSALKPPPGALGVAGEAGKAAAGSKTGISDIQEGIDQLGGLQGAADKANVAFDAIKNRDFSTLKQQLTENKEALGSIAQGAGVVKESFSGIKDAIPEGTMDKLKEAGPKIKDGFSNAKNAVSGTGAKIKDAVTGIKGWSVWAKLSSAATKAWTGIQAAFNLVMSANPIALIVLAVAGLIAAIVIAYKKSDKFREIVQKVWDWIKKLAGLIWDGLVKAFNAVKDAIQPVIDFVKKFWDKLIFGLGPLGIVIGVVVQMVKHWDKVKAVFGVVGDVVMWLWNSVMKPAWEGIRVAIGAVWDWISGTLWPGMQNVFKVIGDIVMWLWNTIIRPAWDGIKLAISVAWDIIRAVFDGMKAGFEAIGNAFQWVWDNVISPVWEWIKQKFEEGKIVLGMVMDKIKEKFQQAADKIGEVKDWIVEKWNNIVDFFKGIPGKIAGAAKGMWDGIKDGFKSMVNSLVDLWNGLADKLSFTVPDVIGMPNRGEKFSPIPKIPRLSDGGLLSGPGTGRSDSILGLGRDGAPTARVSNGEFVMNERSTRMFLPLLELMNKMPALRLGGLVKSLPGLADGGSVKNSGSKGSNAKAPAANPGDLLGNLGGIGDIFANVGGVFTQVWTTVIKPVIDGFGAGVQNLVEAVIKPAVANLTAAFNGFGGMFSGIVTGVLQPMWSNFGATIQGVIQGVISTAFETLKAALTGVQTFFGTTVQGIQKLWDGIRRATGEPINWVIDSAYNKGLTKVWNDIASLIGMDGKKLPNVPTLSFATGGVLPGYTPGRDVHQFSSPTGGKLNLSGGEAIMRPEWTRAVGGPAGVNRMNADAKSGRIRNHSKEGNYSDGGVLAIGSYGLNPGSSISYGNGGFPGWVYRLGQSHGVMPSTYPGHQESNRGEAGYAPNPRGLNRGIDWSGPIPAMQRFAEYLLGVAPKTPTLEQIIWQNPGTGQKIGWHGRQPDAGFGYFASDYPGHQDHVHTRQNGPIIPGLPGDAKIIASMLNGSVNIPSIADMVSDGFSPFDKQMKSAPKNGGVFAQGAIGLAKKAGDELKKFAEKKAKEIDASTGAVTMGGLGGGAEKNAKEIINSAKAKSLGKEGSAIGIATGIVESGLRVLANPAVPESLKMPNEGLGYDHDSVGIFQQRQAGWGTLAQRMNPRASADLFFNAMTSKFPNWRSMDPGAVAQGTQVSAYPDRYGQMMGKARGLVEKLYDTGGWLPPGKRIVNNQTGKPEAVLTNGQWNIAKKNVEAVDKNTDSQDDSSNNRLKTPPIDRSKPLEPEVVDPDIKEPKTDDKTANRLANTKTDDDAESAADKANDRLRNSKGFSQARADLWLKDNQKDLQSSFRGWGRNALKEITSQLTEPIGLNGLSDKGIDLAFEELENRITREEEARLALEEKQKQTDDAIKDVQDDQKADDQLKTPPIDRSKPLEPEVVDPDIKEPKTDDKTVTIDNKVANNLTITGMDPKQVMSEVKKYQNRRSNYASRYVNG
ncbi:tail length tape measure protein [Gordonia phage GMA2]|uniref:Putative tape measure protein n=1 Tax=Gordonia phage GMA2 TaxID=1647283 RepID=A0A0K0N7D2_9CAUD|nr:tail length tape measure protein [Gordonia phage GMA2]AKJ72566.1 putative tape measure protein [Gordonia phage GMA2]